MGLFRYILPRSRNRHSLALDAAPFSPRRLECRRLLDASAAGLLLAPLGDPGDYVQVGEGEPSDPPLAATTSADAPTVPSVISGNRESNGSSEYMYEYAPTVLSVISGDALLSDADVGADSFSLEVLFDEQMLADGSADPVLTFSPTVDSTLTFSSGNWSSDALVYTVTYDVFDVGTTVIDIDVSVDGASNIEGILQEPALVADLFSIDTQNPTVLTVTPSDTMLSDADVGNPFTIDVRFDEQMLADGSADPVLTFSPTVDSTLTFSSGNWSSDALVYTVTYDVVDANVDVEGIGVTVSGARDDAGNLQEPLTNLDVFDIETVNETDNEGLSIDSLIVTPSVNENGVAELLLQISDPNEGGSRTVEIDWGDGSPVETFTLFDEVTVLGASHQYLDDNPTGTASDLYTVQVTVLAGEEGSVFDTAEVTVNNVAPSNLQFAPVAMINENGFAQLQLAFDDPGQLDTHTVEIDWGDGTTTSIELTGGERFVGTNHQYFDDNPSVTGQDEYTITVTVTDDDSGTTTGETTVLVKNVAPSNLQFAPVAMINENGFAQLQLTFDDPGQLDTHTVEIDWGDGTTTTIELTGGERFVGTNHQYLDDDPSVTSQDEYTITVIVTDDDGGMTTGVTTVLVKNVAPVIETLTVTPSVITEGNSVTISGTYSDVGTLDTFTATIRWGDGTVEEVSLDGSGSFEIPHFYADNDTINPDDGPLPDNLYTITVTVADDDGGEAVRPIDVSVLNVNPILEPIIAVTGVNSQGEVTLTIRFTDPGTDTLTVYVDWGDVRDPNDPSVPALEPFVIDLMGIEAPGIFTEVLRHVYDGPPNPLSPASAIEIFVFVGDDDLGETFVQDDGMSQIRTVSVINPGVVSVESVPVVTSAQGQLLFARQVTSNLYFEASSNVEEALRGTGFGAAGGDPNATSDRYLELRVLDSFGNLGEGHRLKIEVLQDLPALFRSLPDKHYAIYLVHVETNTSRLVIEVYVRDGKVIDPGDDSEGTRDRPPTEEATSQREEVRELETGQDEIGQDGAGEDASGARALPENPQSQLSWGPAIAGLVAASSYRSWATRVDQTMAQAGPRQWKRLRLRNPHKRKNR